MIKETDPSELQDLDLEEKNEDDYEKLDMTECDVADSLMAYSSLADQIESRERSVSVWNKLKWKVKMKLKVKRASAESSVDLHDALSDLMHKSLNLPRTPSTSEAHPHLAQSKSLDLDRLAILRDETSAEDESVSIIHIDAKPNIQKTDRVELTNLACRVLEQRVQQMENDLRVLRREIAEMEIEKLRVSETKIRIIDLKQEQIQLINQIAQKTGKVMSVEMVDRILKRRSRSNTEELNQEWILVPKSDIEP